MLGGGAGELRYSMCWRPEELRYSMCWGPEELRHIVCVGVRRAEV